MTSLGSIGGSEVLSIQSLLEFEIEIRGELVRQLTQSVSVNRVKHQLRLWV